jgi:hypothetical protein
MFLFVALLLARACEAQTPVVDICVQKGSAWRSRVRCNGDVLTWCTDDGRVGGTQACGANACVTPRSALSIDSKTNGVASYCRPPGVRTFVFTEMKPQTANYWGCGAVDEQPDAVSMDLNTTEIADRIRSVWDKQPRVPRFKCDSEYPEDLATNTHDLQLRAPTDVPRQIAVPSDTLVGIEVVLLARTELHKAVNDSGDVVQRCYFHDVQLRVDKKESGNRGALHARGAQPVGTDWTEVVFGGPFDLWDWHDFSDLGEGLFVEIDGAINWFDRATRESAATPDGAKIKSKCSVAGAYLRTYYVDASLVRDTAARVIVQGSAGTKWSYFDPRDMSGKGDSNREPDVDWKSLTFKPDTSKGWSTGAGPFGYGEEELMETSHISSRRLFSNFITTFQWNGDPNCVAGIEFVAKVDDAAVVYLNGQPVWSLNFDLEKHGLPLWNTVALRKADMEDVNKYGWSTSRLLLRNGTNTVAAEVHQVNKDSSDLFFDLGMSISVNRAVNGVCTGATAAPATAPPVGTDGPTTTSGATLTTVVLSDADASEPASVATTVVLGGAIIGLLLFFVYLVWKRMKGQRAAAAAGQPSLSFVQFVPEDVQLEAEERGPPPSRSTPLPTLARTEPELKRPAYPDTTSVSVAGAARIEKKQLDKSEWDDF